MVWGVSAWYGGCLLPEGGVSAWSGEGSAWSGGVVSAWSRGEWFSLTGGGFSLETPPVNRNKQADFPPRRGITDEERRTFHQSVYKNAHYFMDCFVKNFIFAQYE